jgi:hypothetical protein
VKAVHWLFGIESVFMCGLFTVLMQPRAYSIVCLGLEALIMLLFVDCVVINMAYSFN